MSERAETVRAAFDGWNGIGGAKRSWAAIGGIWETVRLVLEELLEVGERIVTRQLLVGVGAGSGVSAEMELFGGRVSRGPDRALIGGIRDRATALEIASAAKLPDPQPR